MRLIADLHIHSKYSRATSGRMDLNYLDKAASIKGVQVLSAGDFTHPLWFSDLKQKLVEKESGLFALHSSRSQTRFILTTEISCIYSKNGKVRKIHILIFSPDLKTVEKINQALGKIGNLRADGRPILGLDAKELTKIVLAINPNCFVVPAHIWTPWFSVFGSRSGFNTIEECFEEYSRFIYAGETGLSSSPEMNWRLSALDKIALISNSDAHSPEKIGREANVFETELSYGGIISAIKSQDKKKFLFTIEFFPEEGKYHFDGHKDCQIVFSPKETKKYKGLCPVCQKPLVVGVLSRVEELADRPKGFAPPNKIPFKSLIPLSEIIAESMGTAPSSKKVVNLYNEMIKNFGPELSILLTVPTEEMQKGAQKQVGEAISRVRQGKVQVAPGYDGVYGKIKIFSEQEKKDFAGQKALF